MVPRRAQAREGESDMADGGNEVARRTVLQAAAGLMVAAGFINSGKATETAMAKGTGKPGDFDFLTGEWRIANRFLENGKWIEFPGEATVTSLHGGRASIEELRIPARDFAGTGIRTFDVERAVWLDYWVNAKGGVITPPGVAGVLTDGVFAFISDDVDAEGKPIKVRGVWDEITGQSHRWHQGVSRDGGATWEDGWMMWWTKV